MPYKRFKKTLYVKRGGKWTKKKTYPSANTARTAMRRLRAAESGGLKSRR
jgi:hypothetical protein